MLLTQHPEHVLEVAAHHRAEPGSRQPLLEQASIERYCIDGRMTHAIEMVTGREADGRMRTQRP